jgi:hypothetical protein
MTCHSAIQYNTNQRVCVLINLSVNRHIRSVLFIKKPYDERAPLLAKLC